jgi:tetratricopeptide (TPR) repeat protein
MHLRSPGSARTVRVILMVSVLLSLCPYVLAENRTGDSASWTQRGDDLYLQARYGDAVDAYNKALEIDPYYSIAWNKRGNALTQLGYYEEAIRNYDKAIELDPYYGQAWDNKGHALFRVGLFNESLNAYNRAIAINPNDLHAMVNKGMNLQKLGRNDEARTVYEDVGRIADKEIRRNPNDAKYDADLWSNKGDALFHLGQFPEALSAYNRSLEINPKNPDVNRSRTLLIEAMNGEDGNRSPALEEAVVLPPTPSPSAGISVSVPVLVVSLMVLVYGLTRKKGP